MYNQKFKFFPRIKLRHPLLIFLSILIFQIPAPALEKVTLQLKTTHKFQFAGYYVAKEKGYYKDAGLDVEIREGTPGIHVADMVTAGDAEYGTGSAELLLERFAGKPVVALAAIFQHSTSRIYTLQRMKSLSELEGRRIMLEENSGELLAFLKKEGVPLSSLTFVSHSGDANSLIKGETDAFSGSSLNESLYFKQAGYSYTSFNARSTGIDFYGDNLFTSEKELEEHPERVKAFLEASLKGWRYAIAHRDEVIDLICSKYSTEYKPSRLRIEADRIIPLLEPELVETGYMCPARWRRIADIFSEVDLLPAGYPLDGFIYDPAEKDMTWFYYSIAIAFIIVSLITGIAIYIYRVNRRLSSTIMENEKITSALAGSEERHRLLADHASDVIWTMDSSGRFTYMSPSVERMRGYSPDEVLAQTIEEAFTPESATFVMPLFTNVMEMVKRGEPFPESKMELEQPCRNGNTVWTDVRTTGIYNESGGFIGILGITRDITDRKAAEARVQNLLHEKELLLKEVHHRIKNNMNTIKGILYLHAETLKDTMSVAAIRDAESRIESMVVLYDKLYRSDNFRELSGKEYISMLADEIIGNFPNSGIVTVEKTIEKFVIKADILFYLGIIINEILTNSMKHAFGESERGSITLTLSSEGNRAHLAIGDNGSGLPESETLEKSNGFGMQLIALLTKQIGGTIRIERDAGTKFVLEFNV